MMPFLKKREESVMASEDESIKRKSDDPAGYDMLDAVAQDIMRAVEKRDAGLLKRSTGSR